MSCKSLYLHALLVAQQGHEELIDQLLRVKCDAEEIVNDAPTIETPQELVVVGVVGRPAGR